LAIHVFASTLPLAPPAYAAVLTVAARWRLGHWPTAGSDDPLSALWVGAKGSWDVVCVVMLLGWLAWFVVTPVLWLFEPPGWLLRCVLLFAACTAAAFLIARCGPLDGFVWLNAMD
jgi:hypothetical protein